MDHLEQVVAPEEEYATSRTACCVAEGTGEEGLADAYGSKEEDVFVAIEEAEAEEVTHAVTVKGDGRIPVEIFGGWEVVEASGVGPCGEGRCCWGGGGAGRAGVVAERPLKADSRW